MTEAVLDAIRKDAPELIVNPVPVRPLLALTEISPRAGEWLGRALGLFRGSEDEARRRSANADEDRGDR